MRGLRRAGWLLAGPVMAIVIAGCSSGAAATPADAPASTEVVSQTPTSGTTPAPTPAPTRTDTATPRLATTAAPTPSTTPPPQVPVGTWTGRVVEPSGEIRDWHSYTLVIAPCARGEACGTWSGEGTSVNTGKPAGCSGTLTFLDAVVLREPSDVMGGRLNFSFKETPLDYFGLTHPCSAGRDFLELAADGTSIRYRVKFLSGDEFIAEGTLYLVEP